MLKTRGYINKNSFLFYSSGTKIYIVKVGVYNILDQISRSLHFGLPMEAAFSGSPKDNYSAWSC